MGLPSVGILYHWFLTIFLTTIENHDTLMQGMCCTGIRAVPNCSERVEIAAPGIRTPRRSRTFLLQSRTRSTPMEILTSRAPCWSAALLSRRARLMKCVTSSVATLRRGRDAAKLKGEERAKSALHGGGAVAHKSSMRR